MNQFSNSIDSVRPFLAPPSRPITVAIISSAWHREIVASGIAAIRAELGRARVTEERIRHVEVPGAYEIPLHAKRLARSRKYDAIVACGFVVNGGIYRHEFVASAVIDGLMRVQLETDVPVLSVVLTPRDFHEHADHQDFFREHFIKKGTEAARACLETIASLDALMTG